MITSKLLRPFYMIHTPSFELLLALDTLALVSTFASRHMLSKFSTREAMSANQVTLERPAVFVYKIMAAFFFQRTDLRSEGAMVIHSMSIPSSLSLEYDCRITTILFASLRDKGVAAFLNMMLPGIFFLETLVAYLTLERTFGSKLALLNSSSLLRRVFAGNRMSVFVANTIESSRTTEDMVTTFVLKSGPPISTASINLIGRVMIGTNNVDSREKINECYRLQHQFLWRGHRECGTGHWIEKVLDRCHVLGAFAGKEAGDGGSETHQPIQVLNIIDCVVSSNNWFR